LTLELLILRFIEAKEVLAKEAKTLVIKLSKVLLSSFSERGKCSDCILLDD
jgi:hypothetical protein